MDAFITPPIQPIGNTYSEKKRIEIEKKKPTDAKVKGLVLDKIVKGFGGAKSALLPSAIAPRIMANFLNALAFPLAGEREGAGVELIPMPKGRKRLHLKKRFAKAIPIGLKRCRHHEWINAWIQFLLFLPNAADIFSFLPRNFDPFREFIDQYFADCHEGHTVSLASSASLVWCLLRTHPPEMFLNEQPVNPYEILRLFSRSILPNHHVASKSPFSDSIIFHPERHVIWNPEGAMSLEKALQEKLEKSPPEILVSISGMEIISRVMKRQVFAESGWLCYDLDAFIECRVDDRGHAAYIAYVKVNGSWYQCDDDRITPLLSTTLSVPLHRSVLLHYQRILFRDGQ